MTASLEAIQTQAAASGWRTDDLMGLGRDGGLGARAGWVAVSCQASRAPLLIRTARARQISAGGVCRAGQTPLRAGRVAFWSPTARCSVDDALDAYGCPPSRGLRLRLRYVCCWTLLYAAAIPGFDDLASGSELGHPRCCTSPPS